MVLGVLLVVTTLEEESYVVISFILGSFSFVLHPCAIPTYRAVALMSRNNATPTSLWQNEYANDSESVTMEPLSDFYRKLEPKMKAPYLEKITHIRKDNPYPLKRSDLCKDGSLLSFLHFVSATQILLSTCCTQEVLRLWMKWTCDFGWSEKLPSWYFHSTSSTHPLVKYLKLCRLLNIVPILSNVRHSYAASKAPLRPWVLVDSNGTVLVAHCTCMAGLAETFSHVGAVWVETAVRVRNDTPSTSKENRWLMPTPVKDIPYLELCNIDFTTPKRQSAVLTCTTNTSTNTPTNDRAKIVSPSHPEMQEFFRRIAQEQEKKPIVLPVTQPYSNNFVLSSDHLPKLLPGLYQPAYLESDYTEPLKLAESHLHEEVTPAMVDILLNWHVSDQNLENVSNTEQDELQPLVLDRYSTLIAIDGHFLC